MQKAMQAAMKDPQVSIRCANIVELRVYLFHL